MPLPEQAEQDFEVEMRQESRPVRELTSVLPELGGRKTYQASFSLSSCKLVFNYHFMSFFLLKWKNDHHTLKIRSEICESDDDDNNEQEGEEPVMVVGERGRRKLGCIN